MKVEPGNLYATGGGRKGYWLVTAVTPSQVCPVLGLDLDFNIVSAHTYTMQYFMRKKPVAKVELHQVRFQTESSSETHDLRCSPTSGVSPILSTESTSDGETNRAR